MKLFILRFLFICLLVFFEFSFFDILFPQISVPLLLIASIVAWALIVDFPRVLYMLVPLAMFFDIIATGTLGTLSLYVVPLAYATSFLSRRLLIEHRGTGMVLYSLFSAAGSFGYILFHLLFFQGGMLSWFGGSLINLYSLIMSSHIFLSFFLSVLLFPLIYFVIRRFEAYMGIAARKEVLQMRES